VYLILSPIILSLLLASSALLGTLVQAQNTWYSSSFSQAFGSIATAFYGYSATLPYGTAYTAGVGPYYQTSTDATFYESLTEY